MKHRKQISRPTESFLLFCMNVLFLFVLLIGLFLAYYSLRYSYYSSTDYQIPVYVIHDNWLRNLLFFGAAALLCVLADRLFRALGEKERLAGYVFLGVCCLLYGVMCLIWVRDLPYYPSGDQLNATAAAYYHLKGNFVMLKKTGYLGKFPYQKGLTLLYELLFRAFGDFCYPVAARLHILLGIVTMIFGYLFVEENASHSVCKLLYCPLMVLCAPYVILTPYTYGDLPSICFTTILFWALSHLRKTGKKRYVLLACVMAALALLMRMHTWIVLIAVMIGLLLVALRRRNLLALLTAVLILCCSYGAVKLVDLSYALRSGYEITEGAPMVLSLAMGLQDNENGPGTYNNYQTTTLGHVDFDNQAAAEIARRDIREHLTRFRSDPAYARWFFQTKLLMQWIEPTFETLISTYSFDEEKPVPEWISRIYFGDLHDRLTGFADGYQSVVYLGFLCFLPVLWRRRREVSVNLIPLIAIVGGFLFSIVWEAQCRYVLPYYLFMLFYVPEGICWLTELPGKWLGKK